MKAKIEVGDLHVQAITTTSGIFISQINYANGWRTQTKSNSGFGSIVGDSDTIENCIFIVSDDDIIDSAMEDNSMLISNNKKPENSDTIIHFNGIEVELQSTNAAISIGDNSQSGWVTRSKSNEGNGRFSGDTALLHNKVFIEDKDIVDAPIYDRHLNTNL
ncbi:MAG TPA: hypothetical protein GX497_16450 [Bacillus bacterium]|nr:hypothetical protein [Bacillus sp. (in: firmicutes)]